MIMYSAAAVGWILNIVMAPIMSAYLAVRYEAKTRSIGSRQEALIKEWGSEVKGQAAVQVAASQQLVKQPTVENGDVLEGGAEIADDPAEEEEAAT